jgi:hypothetical protein
VMSTRRKFDTITLRQAALVAGLAYLLNPASYADFSIYPRLIIPGHIEETVQNIIEHANLYLLAIGRYLSSLRLAEVDQWTGFGDRFLHLRTQSPPSPHSPQC